MKYAILKIGSRQYQVSVGDQILIEKINQAPGSSLTFDQILLIADGDAIRVGTPLLTEKVTAKVLDHVQDKKIRVATFKAKSRLRKTIGHRHQYTKIEISAIGSAVATAKKSVSKPVAKKVSSK